MLLIHHTVGSDQAYYVWTPGKRPALVAPSPQNADLRVFMSCMRVVEVSGPAGLDPFIRINEQLNG